MVMKIRYYNFILVVHSYKMGSCKVAVSGSTAAESANQLAIGLEGEDAARLVVHHDDMSIPVHGYSLGAHEAASSNLGLELSLRGEDADPTVVIICHNDVSIGVHCHTCGALQLPRRASSHPKTELELALIGENLEQRSKGGSGEEGRHCGHRGKGVGS